MAETKFTPGPWEFSKGADGENRIYAGVIPGAGLTRAVFDVADVWLPDHGDREANGNLIAAAPELYEALIDAERMLDADIMSVADEQDAVLAKVRAALLKARGGQP